MNSELKNELRQRLAELTAKERKELTRLAAERRAVVQCDKKHPRARWDVEQWTLQILQDRAPRPASTGTVIRVTKERCRVRADGRDLDCALLREYATRQQTALAPGDEVSFEPYGDGWRILTVHPRRTVLTRRDPGNRNRERAIVANVDLIVIVVSVVAPPLHPGIIDRYLAAIHRGGAEACVVVNKLDLHVTDLARAQDLAQLGVYQEIGIPVFPVSTESGEGLEEVRAAISGRTVAFVGHSGVGKSSLLRAMLPESGAVAGRVNDHTGKGRHTTTSSELVEAEGLRIIDTPGVREFAMDLRTPEELFEAFPELQVGRCRFGDCRHLDEPECAVREAVQNGTIPRARYAVYRRLLRDLIADAGLGEPETFACQNCGATVTAQGAGTQHRNHCPRCLHSVHLDNAPGDRAAGCGGTMEPIAVWVRKGGEWAIVHRCRTCGELGSNRIAADDNETLLLSLAVRPLAQPPFPLDRPNPAQLA